MPFPPFGNSDHVVVSVSIDFPSYSQWDASFHCIGYDYSGANWDGLCDHWRDVPREDIFKLSASVVLLGFAGGFRLELMYISLIESIRSSLSHLNDLEVLSSASEKAKLCAENFSKNSNLDDFGISLLVFPSGTYLKLHNISVTPKMLKRS